MAGGREIKTKIKSVQNTRKVTRALEMVSASKIRKAQDLMKASRPYARLMRQVIGHIAKANTEYQHPFMVARTELKRVGYIVVSTDRGVEVDVVAIGAKANAFFKRLKVNLVGSATHLGEKPQLNALIGVIKVMLDAYTDGRVDQLKLAYNDFVNTMTQKPTIDTLLPLPPSNGLTNTHEWDYIYEPGPEVVLDHVLTRYIESLVYQATLENLASEHAARMVAMKSASDNATKAIETLSLIYNKARQAAITQEISEIVGGAAAV